MANLLSWLGGVANDIGGQFNRTANQVQRNVVNPAVNFGVRNVQQAQRNVGQAGANVQRGAFDLQQQANNARRAAEEEARRIAEQRTREIMSIGNQAQQVQRQAPKVPQVDFSAVIKNLQALRNQPQVQKIGYAANPVNQFKELNKQVINPLNQFGQNQVQKAYGINQQQLQDLQKKPLLDRVKFGITRPIELNKQNPAMGIIGSPLNPLGGQAAFQSFNNLNLPKPDLTKMADDASASFARSRVGKNPIVGFAGENIARPIVKSFARYGDVTTGQEKYQPGLRGVSQLGTDVFNIGSTVYTPIRAGKLAQGGKVALKAAPGAFGRGAVAGGGISALNQYSDTGRIDPANVALSALLGGTANVALPVALGGLGRTGSKALAGLRKADVPPVKGYTGNLLDEMNTKFRQGKIDEKQYRAFVVDDFTKKNGRMPMPADVDSFVDVATGRMNRPYVEALRQKYTGNQPQLPVGRRIAQDVPENPLFNEARKYKSADEFVKAQGEPVYHGSNKKIKDLPKLSTQPETNDMMGKAFYVTDSKNHGGYYARRKNGNIVNELVPTKGANIVGFDDGVSNKLRNEQSLPVWVKTNRDAYNYLKVDKGIDDPNTIFAKSGVDGFTQRLSKYDPNNQLLKEQGDSLYTAIINPDKLQTKAQLTDLYNQATKNKPIYEMAPKPSKLPTTPGGTPLKPVNTNRIFDYKSDGVRPVIDPKHKSRVKVYENPYYKGSWSVVVDGKYAGELPNGGASAGNIYKIRDLLTEGRAIKAQDPETADIFKGLQPPKTVYELAPKPKESLPDVIQAGKEDVYYHGTTKSDAESMLKTGFNPKLSVRGKNTESPYALFVSKDKGRLAGDHSAGNYGDGTIVKVTPNTDVKLLDGQSRTWVDSMGQSRGAKESAEWAKKLQKQGYDGIQEANGEITILNPSKFTISEVSPKVKPPTIPSKNKVLPKGINKDDVVEAHQFGSTTKGMVGNDTDIAIFLDPEHPSFAKIGSEYNKKVGKTEYHVFPDNDEGHAVFDAMLDYKDPKYGTGKGIAVKLNKDTIFSTDSIKKDRFGVPFKEESVPVAKLTRNQEYQPRIGQSGEATTANVFKKGYQEGLSDQPMLVRKEGDKYTVLGGHSRTMGIEQRAKAGLDNPTNIKARVYENITDEQARQISRGANQGAQYESTLDMAKSISASISENKAPSVQKQNMVKGFGHDDYKYLWDVVKDNNILKEKVNAGGISAEETLAIARQGRVKGLEPEKVAGVIQGLDKAGKLTRQNAKNVINLLSGKIKAGQMRTNQIGMFGDVEKAVKAVDLLDEYQKVSAELVKKRNALAIATDTLDKKSPAYKELRLKVKEYGQKLKTVETEVVNQYNAKISKNVPEIPSKTPPPPKPPTKKVRMNEYGELQVKERGFVTTVKNSPQTTPEVAKGVKGKYEPINNIDTLDTARKEVGLGKSGRVNNKKAYEEAIDTAKRSEDYSTETQAQSLILIEHLQSKGRTQDAIDIVEKMSERATKNGQASQILAAYNRLKPEGVLMMAQREIDKAKAMNPTKYADLKIEKVQATKLRKMATELQGLTGDERIVAQKEMLDEIGRLVPTPNMTKAVTLWKAGLLTGIKGGVSGNAVGNASNILVKKIADAPASAIDTVITQFTGNRSKVFTLKGWLSGFGEGLKDGKKQIQLGTGADDLASKLDYKKVYFSKNNPAGRFAQKYTDFVFGFYSASDKPWKMAALKNSLTDLATVEAKNKGLKGAAKAKFIKETVEAPPDNLLVQATNDSLDATFQDATALGGMLSGAKRSLAKHGPVAGAVGEVVAPFTGIPSSVATKMYRYSLVSSAVDIVRAIKASNKGQFDQAAQRKVSESIGKGLTGTALLGTGYALWNAGLMTTGMPQDPKERDLWELEGKQPWSVKVGGEWLSLNYTGPVLAILGAGATAAQSIKEGNTLPQTAFIAGMGTAKAVLESSPLKGVQSTLDVISDPARNGPRYLESLAGSTIPTISADVASSIDPLQREAMSPLDAMTNRVPIWRYGLNPKLNPFGEPKANQAFGVQAIVDPFRMSEDRTTSLTTELRNLYNTNKDLGTMPSDFKKDFYGGDTKLNEKQIYDLTAKIKPEIKQAWEQIIADPRYQGLNPEQRKKVLDKAAEDIRAARKFETGVQGGFLNEGEARKKLETGAKRILRGGQTDYINKETGGEDTPKQKYETALNDYEDKKKNGEISSIDEIKIQKALKKLQAQSNFDQDTVDLYGLSLKEIDGYLKSQPNGGDIYQKLLALDDAMEAAGATRKFKNRKLVVSSGKKSTKGRKAKKGGKAKKGTAIKIPSISGSAYKAPKFVTRKIASRKLSTKALPKIKAGKVYV